MIVYGEDEVKASCVAGMTMILMPGCAKVKVRRKDLLDRAGSSNIESLWFALSSLNLETL